MEGQELLHLLFLDQVLNLIIHQVLMMFLLVAVVEDIGRLDQVMEAVVVQVVEELVVEEVAV
jgi:hypothetical protein